MIFIIESTKHYIFLGQANSDSRNYKTTCARPKKLKFFSSSEALARKQIIGTGRSFPAEINQSSKAETNVSESPFFPVLRIVPKGLSFRTFK